MRMWMVDVTKMCNQHLLGEHVEHHMFVGSINKGISMDGYFKNKLLSINDLQNRHDELVAEMERRGMNHKSELPAFTWVGEQTGQIDIQANIQDLKCRCQRCKF